MCVCASQSVGCASVLECACAVGWFLLLFVTVNVFYSRFPIFYVSVGFLSLSNSKNSCCIRLE